MFFTLHFGLASHSYASSNIPVSFFPFFVCFFCFISKVIWDETTQITISHERGGMWEDFDIGIFYIWFQIITKFLRGFIDPFLG